MSKSDFFNLFEQGKNTNFHGRYFHYAAVENYLKTLPGNFNLVREGYSVLGRPLYSIEIGNGNTRILMWSQMHGNETTTTKAVLDLISTIGKESEHSFVKHILKACRLKIIVVLNADGAENYTRKNANNVDLNRDAAKKTQPESDVLQSVAADFKPDFCFNLHDQRTIFAAGKSSKPATLSFLAPAFNAKRDVNAPRKTAMQLIAGINGKLQEHIPGQVGRYDDKFNKNCIGDFFQSKGIPTVLLEAGHYPEDYAREKTRQFVYLALCHALELLSSKSWSALTSSAYFKIPENQKIFFDILVKNANANNTISDIAIQYTEKLDGNNVEFIPKVAEIRNLSGYYGHRTIEANEENIKFFSAEKIKIGNVVKGMTINGQIYSTILTNN